MGSSKVVCLVFALQLASCLTTIEATDEPDDVLGHALNARFDYKPYNESWAHFKSVLGRLYNESEEAYRRVVFEDNLKKIEAHNANFHKGNATFYMGINHFTDMTFEEFTDKYLSSLPKAGPYVNATEDLLQCSPFVNPYGNYPNGILLTPWATVKDQGEDCGSCWAFSAAGAIEYQYKKTRPYVSLSEQQLIDCSRPYGNSGCDGGWPSKAFAYINDVGGIESSAAYPYTAKAGTCKFNEALPTVTTVSDCRYVAHCSEDDLKAAVATGLNAVSVAIHITEAFKSYCGGVFTDDDCATSSPNHAVLVVGYGRTDWWFYSDQDYWVVQNSWGPTWGEMGFIRMRRNYKNMCGIATYAMYPILPDADLTSEQSTCRASSNMAFSLSIVTGIVLLVQAIVS